MTKFYYTCTKDKELIIKSFNKVAKLVFGSNKERLREFIDFYQDIVKEISIHKADYEDSHIYYQKPGICRLDEDKKIVIEMLGYNKAKESDYDFIKHEAIHEFMHSFADILPYIYETNRKIIRDNAKYQTYMGLVKETNVKTGKFVGQHHYGKMFNETMMDLISFISADNSKIDDILYNPSYVTNVETDYSIFYPIAKLMIVAFSNKVDVNYLEFIKNKQGIFDLKEENYYLNDFLYGILFNPLHIEINYDKYMGEGSYLELCHTLDGIFVTYIKSKKINKSELKECLNFIKTFFKIKCKDYLDNNIMSKKDITKLVIRFNNILRYLEEYFE